MLREPMIPWQWRESVRSLLAAPSRLAARRRLEEVRCAGTEVPRCGFGGVLNDGRPIHGGAVKLLPLREAFPSDEREFNILYAVSSSQPRFAEDVFRWCRRQGIRIVWNQNGVGYPAWAGRESERFNAPMRRQRAMVDFVVYQSRFCEESAGVFLGPSSAPSQLLYNPVDTVRFHPAAGRRREGPVRLLAAGTHGTRDRVMNVLDAVEGLVKDGRDVELTVAGGFQWRSGEEDVRDQIRKRSLAGRVSRVARFSQSDAVGLYQSHEILVHPKYMDPCPTVVLEAMACGLAVVGSASGGMPEMVDGACGVLVPAPKDWEVRHTPSGDELAAGIVRVMEGLPAFSEAARRRAEDVFSVGPWVEAHRAVFLQLLG